MAIISHPWPSSLSPLKPNYATKITTRAAISSNTNIALNAATHTVDTYIQNGMVIGLGSGVVSHLAIQYLGQQLRSGALHDIVGVPM